MPQLINEKMVALFAPDGSFQAMTLSPDFPTCIATIRMMHKAGLSKSYHQMCVMGDFKILPCIVSIEVKGTEEDAFKTAKEGK